MFEPEVARARAWRVATARPLPKEINDWLVKIPTSGGVKISGLVGDNTNQWEYENTNQRD